jgi:hypothetical protein
MKSIARVECLIEIDGEWDSLSDYQHEVCSTLGGLFLEDEDWKKLNGLHIIKIEPNVPQ